MSPAPRLPWRRHSHLRQGPLAAQAPTLQAAALLASLPNGVVLRALDGRVVEAAGVGTWEWDMQANTLSCNDRLPSMLGYQRGEVALLRDADAAMYQAKRLGRARYAVFDPAQQATPAAVIAPVATTGPGKPLVAARQRLASLPR